MLGPPPLRLRARAFQIRGGDSTAADEEALANFLRTAKVERIETAHGDGAWQILVLFHDDKSSEESAQIASVIANELKAWRRDMARNTGEAAERILTTEDLDKIAHYVPTTAIELRLVLGAPDGADAPYENEIVAVVRRSMDELV